jgi:hypothetical protein
MTLRGLRSRVGRFESCRGLHPAPAAETLPDQGILRYEFFG